MTAEIAILNKSGVALAADSAVSSFASGSPKIYNTNKLFMLSKHRPVGIMIYGNAELMNIPYETIIKSYRQELADTSFKNLKDYAVNFLSFLNGNSYLFPMTEQGEYVYRVAFYIFNKVKAEIDNTIEQATKTGTPQVSASDIDRITNETIKDDLEIIKSYRRVSTLPPKFESAILTRYYQVIEQAIDDIFKKHTLSTLARKQLRRIGVGLFTQELFDAKDSSGRQLIPSSGLVIAGFGEDDLYPSLVAYDIECVVNDTLKYREGGERHITSGVTATLIPFAQKEMVLGFMNGVTPDYRQALFVSLKELFDKYPEKLVTRFKHLTVKEKTALVDELKKDGSDLLDTFWDTINKWAKKYNADPIVDNIEILPIAELAQMAESLVNLTSFKRRMTIGVPETVGGPIDVAVISKGDGFIWIKRKHYFEATSNPHFFKNYFR